MAREGGEGQERVGRGKRGLGMAREDGSIPTVEGVCRRVCTASWCVHSQLSHLRCLALAKAKLLQEQVSSLRLLPDVVELNDLLHRPSGYL